MAAVVVVAGAAVEVFDLINSDVALAPSTDLVSWPSSTRKQQVTATGGTQTKGTLKSHLAIIDGWVLFPTNGIADFIALVDVALLCE